MRNRPLPLVDGLRCPHCEYDLRGLTRRVCPECGNAFTVADILSGRTPTRRRDKLFQTMAYLPAVWLVVYFVLTDFFSGTADNIDRGSPFFMVEVVFLAMPLQITLWPIACLMLWSPRPAARRLGRLLLVTVLGLIAGHVLVSVITCIA